MRRLVAWAVGVIAVGLVAYAPFRDTNGNASELPLATGSSPTSSILDDPDGTTAVGSGPTGSPSGGSGGGLGSNGGATDGPSSTPGDTPIAVEPEVPDLPQPTARELAVLSPLIAAMDTGQRAGTPLVLGIATSVIATGLPSDESLPPELRPVLSALAQLIATPGTQVNDLTAQNSVHLAQLDRALGELAFLNPALNATIHQTADLLAAMGRSAEPVSPPGAVSLTDLSILLGFFVAH